VWSPLEIDILRTAAALIAGSIERARRDEQLRLSEERYAMAARGANDGLLDWNLASGKAYFSLRLHEIVGVPEGELGDTIEALFARFLPEDSAAVKEGLQQHVVLGQHKFAFEARMVDGGRGWRWLTLGGLIVYRDGRPRRVVGALREITDRK